MKAYCIWCESPTSGTVPKNGYYWIHQNCAHNLMNIKSDIQSLQNMLEGIHPRNS